MIAIEFYQIAMVKDLYIFKDDDKDYGLLTVNFWNSQFCIYSLTQRKTLYSISCIAETK